MRRVAAGLSWSAPLLPSAALLDLLHAPRPVVFALWAQQLFWHAQDPGHCQPKRAATSNCVADLQASETSAVRLSGTVVRDATRLRPDCRPGDGTRGRNVWSQVATGLLVFVWVGKQLRLRRILHLVPQGARSAPSSLSHRGPRRTHRTSHPTAPLFSPPPSPHADRTAVLNGLVRTPLRLGLHEPLPAPWLELDTGETVEGLFVDPRPWRDLPPWLVGQAVSEYTRLATGVVMVPDGCLQPATRWDALAAAHRARRFLAAAPHAMEMAEAHHVLFVSARQAPAGLAGVERPQGVPEVCRRAGEGLADGSGLPELRRRARALQPLSRAWSDVIDPLQAP